jgi:hypothetical protein
LPSKRIWFTASPRLNLGLTAAFIAFPQLGVNLNTMDSTRELGRLLLVLGGLFVIVGAFFYFGGKLPFRLGRLPGDIAYEGKNSSFYFPITTSIVISVGLSLLVWLISRFRR